MDLFDRPPLEIICYTAGLFDGEGSIYFLAGDSRFGFDISQSERNNGGDLVRWLRDQWQVGTINRQRKQFYKDKPTFYCWHWSVNAAREVEHVITLLLPYLRVKRDPSEQALSYIRSKIAAGARVAWTPNERRYLAEHWREPDTAIGDVLGRTAHAVLHQRRKLDLDKPPGGIVRNAGIVGESIAWSADETAYLSEHVLDPDQRIAAKLGRTVRAVRGKRSRLGLPRPPSIL